MKHFKKFFSYLVALTMVLSLAAFTGVKVHADTTTGNSLTITNTGKTAHTFELYQIFTGTKSKDENSKALGNIHWGSGVNTKKDGFPFGDAATKAATLNNDVAAAKAFAKALADGGYLQSPRTSDPVDVGKTCTFDNLATGYYLVKDTANSQADTSGLKNSSYTEYICKVVGKTEAGTKLDVPSVEKKVKDTNDSDGTTSEWQDSADYDIGDSIPYKLTATLGTKYADYKTYKLEFVDNLSAGLSYDDKVNYKVTVDTEDGADITNAFTKSQSSDGKTITWTCNDLKKVIAKDKDDKVVTINAGSKIIVTYNAKLEGDNVVIGSKGNSNTVYLKYSNNPNYTGDGEKSPEGQTPTDKNIVFTYKAVVNKVDQDSKPLPGAKFDLLKKAPNDNEGKEVWTIVATGIEAKKVTDESGNVSYTAEYKGLDDGDYKLIESTTPAGYNTIAPIEFTISAEHEKTSDDPKLTELSGNKADGTAFLEASQDKDGNLTGELTASVENQKGPQLPETGGMGTTLLYVAGGILVACAAAYVVMSRKHSTNK